VTAYSPTKLVLLDNNESGLHDLVIEISTRHPDLNLVPALIDIKNPTLLRSLFIEHRPQVVFHAAAYKHVPMLERYPQQALEVNIRGTINVAELALTYGVERFVLISTDKAVKPSSVMGASKRVCELMLHALSQSHASDTRFTSVRFGNVLGSRGSVVPTFDRQIDEGGPVTVTHEDMTRYFMSIPEAVNLILHAVCLTEGDDIYVLQMGEVVRIVELAERMIRMRGLRPYRDIDIKFTGMRPGEKMHEELFNEIEKPAVTSHPYIFKIEGWDPEFDVLLFMERLSKLSEGLSSKEVLSLLHDAIESKYISPIESMPPVPVMPTQAVG
ncbi:MAG: polysaccharide biosynthesis protein, partial [Anaerolineae bacterium]|nr:polysaccharide biosynthesis protein [Anaerolineae bacterium]